MLRNFSRRCRRTVSRDSPLSSLSALSIALPVAAMAAAGSRCAPPAGSAMMLSMMPSRAMSAEVIFMLVAASILWRDTTKAQEAATNMKITSADMARFGIIDSIITEPAGGAHRDPAAAIAATGNAIDKALGELKGLSRDTVRRQRREKFLSIGRAGLA